MLKINEIYNLDVFNFLNQVDREVVDLAIIDPPYNMRKAKWDVFRNSEDYFTFTFEWIDALLPKLKSSASLYVFNTPRNAAYILPYLEEKRMVFQNWITWHKRDGISGSRSKYNNEQETILFFTKSKKYTFNYDNIRLPYVSTKRIEHAKKKGIIKNGKRWFPNPKGRLCGEVWNITSERHKNKINGKTVRLDHVTPKPIEMLLRMIKASSNPGDLVLDCFVGTGSTAIAAKILNRNYICNDFYNDYVLVAQKKLREIEEQFNGRRQNHIGTNIGDSAK
jgi:site-specific DNA-methyltransferase (adenine-specific)